MEVKELYRQILGIEEPWKVSEVELDVKGERIDVQVVHDEGVRWPCPECGELLTVYDHAPSGSGVIWILVSLRPIFTLVYLGLIVRFMGSGR